MTDELKPCPFCDGKAEFGVSRDGFFVNCTACLSATNHLTDHGLAKNQVASAWNTRAAPKVKPLVWVEHNGTLLNTEHGYMIKEGFREIWSVYFLGNPVCPISSSCDGAKDRAFEFHERRILSALE